MTWTSRGVRNTIPIIILPYGASSSTINCMDLPGARMMLAASMTTARVVTTIRAERDEEVCYNCARFEDKNRGFAMALSSRFEEALVFATQLHAGQRRKGTAIPYIAHLLGVTSIVLEQGGNEDEAIAALLHD